MDDEKPQLPPDFKLSVDLNLDESSIVYGALSAVLLQMKSARADETHEPAHQYMDQDIKCIGRILGTMESMKDYTSGDFSTGDPLKLLEASVKRQEALTEAMTNRVEQGKAEVTEGEDNVTHVDFGGKKDKPTVH